MMPVAAIYLGAGFCTVAIALVTLVVLKPTRSGVPLERRRPFGTVTSTGLESLTGGIVSGLNRTVGGGPYNQARLEQAGLKMRPVDFLVLVVAAASVLGLIGLLLGGLGTGIVFALLAFLAAFVLLSVLASRRRARFDGQLGDNIMLISGGLRAGHSILRAIDAAAQEAPSPSAEEFARVINETRIGRDLQESLQDVSARMKSEDFRWIGQAIQINREVGGDLAEVMDNVGETIRERGQIKAQIKALSAEGRLSAIILIALPFFITLMLMLVNPTYLAVLTRSVIGWILLAVGAIMMTIGSLWLRKIIQIKF